MKRGGESHKGDWTRSEEFAMKVKGMEIPMHDPRLKQGLGLHYSANLGGADHAGLGHDTELEKGP